MPEVTLPQGTITYTDDGPRDAPVLVFVHGFLVDSSLWQPVLQHLRGELRCVAPDLPLRPPPPPPLPPDPDEPGRRPVGARPRRPQRRVPRGARPPRRHARGQRQRRCALPARR